MVRPDGQVVGVGMTLSMLEKARAAAAEAGLSNAEFREGYGEALPVQAAGPTWSFPTASST